MIPLLFRRNFLKATVLWIVWIDGQSPPNQGGNLAMAAGAARHFGAARECYLYTLAQATLALDPS